jgi:hypothetical protein
MPAIIFLFAGMGRSYKDVAPLLQNRGSAPKKTWLRCGNSRNKTCRTCFYLICSSSCLICECSAGRLV